MNKIILNLFILIVSCSFVYGASERDTSITLSLEKGKPNQVVICNYNDSLQTFTLKIGISSVSGVFDDAFDIDLEALDIDKGDDYNLLVLKGMGPDDDNDCYFYEYVDGKILQCGHIVYTNKVSAGGNKILKADSWMGFWTLTENYYFDSKSRTLVKKPKDTYDLNAEGKVTSKFKLLEQRSDNSSSAGTLKPGFKITVTKADITPKCKDTDGNDDSWRCFWYYIRASDGTEGWCRLRDFQENVEGLPWAG